MNLCAEGFGQSGKSRKIFALAQCMNAQCRLVAVGQTFAIPWRFLRVCHHCDPIAFQPKCGWLAFSQQIESLADRRSIRARREQEIYSPTARQANVDIGGTDTVTDH